MCALNGASAMGLCHAVSGHNIDARCARPLLPYRIDCSAGVREHDSASGAGEITCPLVCKIVACHQQYSTAGDDRVSIEIGRNRSGCHDTGEIIISEHKRPLNCASGQHDAIGAYTMQALAALSVNPLLGRYVVLHRLNGLNQIGVVERKRTGAGQNAHVRHGLQFADAVFQPLCGRYAADYALRSGEQPAAQLVLLVEQHDIEPSATGHQCGQ